MQAVEAVRYIHSKGVLHCDISIHNFLVQNNGSIMLADFCGSVLDNSKPIAAPGTRYSRPVLPTDRFWDATEKDDIFALGTVLYEISVGHRLYAEKSDREVRQLFQKREFPDITGLAGNLHIVVEKCWQDQYDSAEEIKFDLGSKYLFALQFLLYPSANIANDHLCRFRAFKPSFYPSIVTRIFWIVAGVLVVLIAIRLKSASLSNTVVR